MEKIKPFNTSVLSPSTSVYACLLLSSILGRSSIIVENFSLLSSAVSLASGWEIYNYLFPLILFVCTSNT